MAESKKADTELHEGKTYTFPPYCDVRKIKTGLHSIPMQTDTHPTHKISTTMNSYSETMHENFLIPGHK